MNNKRTWYNARLVVSVLLSIAATISFANYYFDLGYFGDAAKDVLFGIAMIGIPYALFLTPKEAEFREHGWWWREGD